MPSDKKLAGPAPTLIILGVLCGSALAAIFLGPRLIAYEILRSAISRKPKLSIVPMPLPESLANALPGTTVSRYGYAFEVPWNDLEGIHDSNGTSLVSFKSGHSVSFADPASRVNRIKTMRDQAAQDGRDVRTLFGQDAVSSNYRFLEAVFSVTPNRVSLLSPKNEILRDSILVVTKDAEMRDQASGLYSVRTAYCRGFQIGDPSRGDRTIVLQLFDPADHELFVQIGTSDPVADPITQADVNRILQTLHVVP